MADLIADPFRAARLILLLRRQGIRDDAVLSAMETIDRAVFVDPGLSELAYEDTVLPIPCGQILPKPVVVAQLLGALQMSPGKEDRVLLIGSGSGYMAVLLAQIGRHVWAIDRYQKLVTEARARMLELKVENVTLKHADGLNGWPEHKPFDRILLTGAVSGIPEKLLEQLTKDGVLVTPFNRTGQDQVIRRVTANGREVDFQILEPLPLLRSGKSDAL
ncbi:protein-L-isoaspartate(D-aspartate) O-methyltransferase [Henriciella aquimarina]|uniref:protein-L-isoaspartate(D-aspartate) O-methyltransferase n=1 Tax=Henriciella aquimarina TaxID=545261 RepID=UPI0009FD7E3C|nr:protein-L-isoaspartate(D-aspartate) O-methyltransferase [Henriciella aquimarina]